MSKHRAASEITISWDDWDERACPASRIQCRHSTACRRTKVDRAQGVSHNFFLKKKLQLIQLEVQLLWVTRWSILPRCPWFGEVARAWQTGLHMASLNCLVFALLNHYKSHYCWVESESQTSRTWANSCWENSQSWHIRSPAPPAEHWPQVQGDWRMSVNCANENMYEFWIKTKWTTCQHMKQKKSSRLEHAMQSCYAIMLNRNRKFSRQTSLHIIPQESCQCRSSPRKHRCSHPWIASCRHHIVHPAVPGHKLKILYKEALSFQTIMNLYKICIHMYYNMYVCIYIYILLSLLLLLLLLLLWLCSSIFGILQTENYTSTYGTTYIHTYTFYIYIYTLYIYITHVLCLVGWNPHIKSRHSSVSIDHRLFKLFVSLFVSDERDSVLLVLNEYSTSTQRVPNEYSTSTQRVLNE